MNVMNENKFLNKMQMNGIMEVMEKNMELHFISHSTSFINIFNYECFITMFFFFSSVPKEIMAIPLSCKAFDFLLKFSFYSIQMVKNWNQ